MGTCGNSEKEKNKKKNDKFETANDFLNQSQLNTVNLEKLEQNNFDICYIMEKNQAVGVGFLCIIPFPDNFNKLPVFITGYKIITSNDILQGKEIRLLFNKIIFKTIKINESRKIFISSGNEYDTIIIEIKKDDELEIYKKLEIDYDIIKEDNLNFIINLPIYTINYSSEKNSTYSNGFIKRIDRNYFKIDHSCASSESSLSGAPIINFKNTKIIGFNIQKNIGILLRNPIKEFIKLYKPNNEIIIQNNNNFNVNNSQKEIEINNDISEDKINNIISSHIDNNEDSKEEIKKRNNEINLILEITKEDINKNIFFLGIINELNENNTQILINSEEQNFRKYFIPQMEGIYNIKIIIDAPIKDCNHMFSDCNKILNIDLSSFNTENVTNMSYMFSGCNKLEKIDLSSFDTKNVTNMSFMFKGCSNLTNLNLSSLNTKNVNYMIGMFSDCSKLTDLDMSSLDTTQVIYMSYIFSRCSNLININLSSLDTQNVTNMSSMFESCNKLTNINLSSLDTKNVEYMIGMFSKCSNLENIDLSTFNTQSLISTSHMFSGCVKLKNIDLSFFNTNNIINMSYMFFDCSDLVDIDLSSLDAKKVTNTNYMFSGCDNLNTIKINKNSFDKKKSKLNKKVNIISN